MPETDIIDLRFGLCGWNGSQRTYFKNFDSIEIQSTFYDPPSLQVARKWRAAAPVDFQFCIQSVAVDYTHTAASPTYAPFAVTPPGRRPRCRGFVPTN
jgi:uncharacterized protein YecE (DUF72 family)